MQGIYDGPGSSTSDKKSAKKRWRSGFHVVEVLSYNTDICWQALLACSNGLGSRVGINEVGKMMRQIS